MYLSQRYSLEDFNEVLDKNNPEVFKIKQEKAVLNHTMYFLEFLLFIMILICMSVVLLLKVIAICFV